MTRKNKGRISTFLGIDLGTTYSSVAYIDFSAGRERERADIEPSNVMLIDPPSDGNAYLLPTLVDYGPSIPEVGRRVSGDKRYVIGEFKLDLGLERRYELPNGQSKRCEEVAIDVLRYLKRRAEDSLGSSLGRVCLAIPSVVRESYQTDKTPVMSEIGKRVGFTSINVVEEPIAAILDIDFTTGGILTHEDKTIMVVDYGGGTCNVAMVRASYKKFLWSKPPKPLGFSVERCGGKFIDESIVRWVKEYRPEAEQIFQGNLKEVSRRLKEKMSRFLQGEEITNPSEIDGYDFRLGEETFRNLSYPVIQKMINAVKGALEQARIQKGELDLVFLVGGGSQHPLVKEILLEYFREKGARIPSFERAKDPQLSISRGAALYDFYCEVGQLPMVDELRQELYLQFPGGSMKRLAKLGQRVPFKRPNRYEIRVTDSVNEIVLQLKKRDPQSGIERVYASPVLTFEDLIPAGSKIRLDVIVDLRQHTIIKAYTRKRANLRLSAEVIVRSPVS